MAPQLKTAIDSLITDNKIVVFSEPSRCSLQHAQQLQQLQQPTPAPPPAFAASDLAVKGTKQFPQCGFSNTVVQVRVVHERSRWQQPPPSWPMLSARPIAAAPCR